MRAHSMRFNRPVSPFPFLRAWTIRGHSIRSTKSSSPSAVMASGTTRTDAGRRSGPISETLGPARATARSMAFSSSRTLPGQQELHLHGRRDLADLIQEERAAVGLFELSPLLRHGPGKGATLVPEELRFQKGLRQRAAIDREEPSGPPRTELVDQPRRLFLAGPGLPGDQNGDVGLRDGPHETKQLLHGTALPDQSARFRRPVQLLSKLLVLLTQLAVAADDPERPSLRGLQSYQVIEQQARDHALGGPVRHAARWPPHRLGRGTLPPLEPIPHVRSVVDRPHMQHILQRTSAQHARLFDPESLEVFARAARWTISGVGLSLFPASGRFNFHLERPGRRHRSAGLSLLDQPSGRSAPGPFRLQYISLAELGDNGRQAQLRVLLLAGSGFHERIELGEPLDVALDQQTVPDLRIDRGQKPGQHVQGVRLVRAGEGLHAEVIAVG